MEGDELPAYTPRSGSSQAPHAVRNAGSEYSISHEDHKGHKWLLFSVKSRAPTPDFLPIFYSGDLISGSVTLNLLKPETFKSITVKVTAGTILTGQEHEFLFIEKELWSPPTALPDGSKASKLEKGRHVWPFEFILPKEVEVIVRKQREIFPLPPSFAERTSPVYINYRVTVFVTRRGVLGENCSLFAEFSYIPITKPALPSPLIQMAYTENTPLVGPEVDPEGWHTLPPASIIGTLFDAKPVNVGFTLAITKPLSYACGSAMPLRLIFTGTDEQALDVLSSPYAANILLMRSLDPGTQHAKNHKFVRTIARAVFWLSKDASTAGTRVLEGEMELKITLKQSNVFPRCTVQYYLEVLPFEITGFVHAPHVYGPLLTQPVTITSFHATGIVMRSFAPPEYAQEQHEDYTAIGLLEGGTWGPVRSSAPPEYAQEQHEDYAAIELLEGGTRGPG